MITAHLNTLMGLLQQTAAFGTDAPLGTGLEWMTVWSVIVPALLLVALVYLGTRNTV